MRAGNFQPDTTRSGAGTQNGKGRTMIEVYMLLTGRLIAGEIAVGDCHQTGITIGNLNSDIIVGSRHHTSFLINGSDAHMLEVYAISTPMGIVWLQAQGDSRTSGLDAMACHEFPLMIGQRLGIASVPRHLLP